MSKELLAEQIAGWHAAGEHNKICEAVLALPEQEQTDELICLLARALNNKDDFCGALEVLDSIRNRYSDNPFFCVRYGFALYQLHREHEALDWFRKAQAGGLEEINETPGTYHPKSIAKWIIFAERWAPRRIEKNAFEAECRIKRSREPQHADFTDFDFSGFWDDCDYSLEKYTGNTPADTEIEEAEAELGYRLPESYKALVRLHNGGLLLDKYFENPLQREWEPQIFGISSIYGISSDKMYSLTGDRGSRFWITEWGYPDIGVAVCDCPSGGHDMIFLDYSYCGPEGEPCVVHIHQEGDYERTYLADNFEDFVRGLISMDEDGE